MKKLILLSLFLVACQTNQTQPVIIPDEVPPVEEPETSTVEVALVAMGDGTMTGGETIGCGDTIQLVEKEVAPNGDAGTVKAALEALFAIEGSDYGESGLYNALYQSDITVGAVAVGNGNSPDATVDVSLSGSIISGGTCDDPRIEEQIRATVEANAPEGATITILFDGEDLHEYFDLSGL